MIDRIKIFFNKKIYDIATFLLYLMAIIFTPSIVLTALGIISMETFQIIGLMVVISPFAILLLIGILFG